MQTDREKAALEKLIAEAGTRKIKARKESADAAAQLRAWVTAPQHQRVSKAETGITVEPATVTDGIRLPKEKIAAMRETLAHYRPAYLAAVGDDGTGCLELATYRDLACGCRVTGNGTLQLPLTVIHCPLHQYPTDALRDLATAATETVQPHDDKLLTAIRRARFILDTFSAGQEASR